MTRFRFGLRRASLDCPQVPRLPRQSEGGLYDPSPFRPPARFAECPQVPRLPRQTCPAVDMLISFVARKHQDAVAGPCRT
jgi:hypothetical protein